jgi:hypothetical protein
LRHVARPGAPELQHDFLKQVLPVVGILAVEATHTPHQRLVVVQGSQKIGRRGGAHGINISRRSIAKGRFSLQTADLTDETDFADTPAPQADYAGVHKKRLPE